MPSKHGSGSHFGTVLARLGLAWGQEARPEFEELWSWSFKSGCWIRNASCGGLWSGCLVLRGRRPSGWPWGTSREARRFSAGVAGVPCASFRSFSTLRLYAELRHSIMADRRLEVALAPWKSVRALVVLSFGLYMDCWFKTWLKACLIQTCRTGQNCLDRARGEDLSSRVESRPSGKRLGGSPGSQLRRRWWCHAAEVGRNPSDLRRRAHQLPLPEALRAEIQAQRAEQLLLHRRVPLRGSHATRMPPQVPGGRRPQGFGRP